MTGEIFCVIKINTMQSNPGAGSVVLTKEDVMIVMQWAKFGRHLTACLIFLAVVAASWTQVACAQDPKDVTICDINMLTGVAVGDLVRVSGICTVGTDRFGGMMCVISTPEGGPYCCGLKIYDQEASLVVSIGQCLTVVGTVEGYYGNYEILLDLSYEQEVWECGWKIPDPERVTECTFSDAYKSCQIVLEGLTVQSDPDQYGNFIVTDRYGCERTLLLRMIDPVYPVGTEICSLTGFLDYHFEEFKIRPIDDESIDPRPLSDCPWMGTACDPVKIRSYLSTVFPDCISGGEQFIHSLTFTNLCTDRDAMLFDVLEIGGGFWFWPGWTTDIDFKTMNLPELAGWWESVFDFTWPAQPPITLSGTFWTAALDASSGLLISDIVSVSFCAGP